MRLSSRAAFRAPRKQRDNVLETKEQGFIITSQISLTSRVVFLHEESPWPEFL